MHNRWLTCMSFMHMHEQPPPPLVLASTMLTGLPAAAGLGDRQPAAAPAPHALPSAMRESPASCQRLSFLTAMA